MKGCLLTAWISEDLSEEMFHNSLHLCSQAMGDVVYGFLTTVKYCLIQKKICYEMALS